MSSNIVYKVARKISYLGNSQGFTIRSLSQKSDVSASTIRRILNTRVVAHNPSLNTLVKLSRAFKMPLNQFVDFTPTTRQ